MIDGIVTGDAEVVARFERMGLDLRRELRAGIGRLVLILQRNVKSDKLSGQVLKVRTGRLRRSIEQVVVDRGEQVAGIVSTPVKYAPPHEYGFKGTEDVKAHLRSIRQAFGRPITERKIEVSAHTRQVDLPARSFLRSALHDLERSGDIGREISKAAGDAIR